MEMPTVKETIDSNKKMRAGLNIMWLMIVVIGALAQYRDNITSILDRITSRASLCQSEMEIFTSWSDFTGFITPPSPSYDAGNGIRHALVNVTFDDVSYNAYQATIYDQSVDILSAFATLKFSNMPLGVITTPVYIDFFFLMQDLVIPSGFASIAKFSPNDGTMNRFITIELDSNNVLHLNYVPNQIGHVQYLYQNVNNTVPLYKWVNVSTYIDWSSSDGIVVVWQDGVLQSAANIAGGNGYLKQMNLGIEASGSTCCGSIYNYLLDIQRVCKENVSPNSPATSFPVPPVTQPRTRSYGSTHSIPVMLVILVLLMYVSL
jgi:hypothetical protein